MELEKFKVQRPYQGLECKTLAQNPSSVIISTWIAPHLTPGVIVSWTHVPALSFGTACAFSCQHLSPSHFQTSHGTPGLLTERKATEQTGLKEVEPGRLQGREEPQHLRGRGAVSPNLAEKLLHPPGRPEQPQ